MVEEAERRYRNRERVGVGGCGVGGGSHGEFSPWRHTGSPKIRRVINLSVVPANPTAPRPGNLASGGGRAGGSKGTPTGWGGREKGRRGREMRKNMLY